jgi:hypothetical protein
MSETLRLTIAYDEPDEDGWIVARVVEVPGAISQGRTREEAMRTICLGSTVELLNEADILKGPQDALNNSYELAA